MEYAIVILGICLILFAATKIFSSNRSEKIKPSKGDYLVDGKESKEAINQNKK